MRIGIIADALDRQYAGIYQYVKHMVHLLPQIDGDNEYFAFVKRERSDLVPIQQILLSDQMTPSRRMADIFLDIPRLANQYRLDVVIEPAHFGPFRLDSSVKRVTVIHDLTPLLFPAFHDRKSAMLQRALLPRIVRRADLLLTNSHYTKSDMIEHLGVEASKICVSHLGVDSIFSEPILDEVLYRHGIHKQYILYGGTIEPRKNVLRLIKAFERYKEEHPSELQLILMGKEGWKSQDVIRLKYDSPYRDDIILLGYVDRQDMPAIYQGAELFVYPSLYEGFGLPVLEAMASGTNVLTSENSSLSEIGMEYVTYCDPYDVDSIKKGIVVGLDKDNLSDEVIAYARSFTWEKTMSRIAVALGAISDFKKH